jgi:hypothetical protein
MEGAEGTYIPGEHNELMVSLRSYGVRNVLGKPVCTSDCHLDHVAC